MWILRAFPSKIVCKLVIFAIIWVWDSFALLSKMPFKSVISDVVCLCPNLEYTVSWLWVDGG